MSHNPVVGVASPWQTSRCLFTCNGPNEFWARWQQPDDRYVRIIIPIILPAMLHESASLGWKAASISLYVQVLWE